MAAPVTSRRVHHQGATRPVSTPIATRRSRFRPAVVAGGAVAVVMGGGYCPALDEIVAIHLETVRQARAQVDLAGRHQGCQNEQHRHKQAPQDGKPGEHAGRLPVAWLRRTPRWQQEAARRLAEALPDRLEQGAPVFELDAACAERRAQGQRETHRQVGQADQGDPQ